MKIASWPSLMMLCICGVSLHAAAEEATGEAVVNGARLPDLKKAMNKAQDRFLALYNQVNRNVDQQVACADSAPTGSRLTQRSCSTRAQNRATEEQARNFLTAIDGTTANQAQNAAVRDQATTKAQTGAPLSADESAALSGMPAANSDVDSKAGEAAGKVSQEALEFEENLQKLIEKNPDLKQRYEEYLGARRRYQQAGGRL